ncbi:MAG: SCP2 sterol-binding domain-containing protein [Pseudomonadota bacterium]
MSEMLDKAATALAAKVSGADADIDAKVKFEIDGVGTLVMDGAQTPPAIAKGDGDADVTVSADADVFQQLMDGALDPTAAYMGGQLRIDGDMGLAMKLAQILA